METPEASCDEELSQKPWPYPPEKIPLPANIADPRTNSPYAKNARSPNDPAYRDPKNIRQMTSIYDGMVAEIDEWVGTILHRLDELGLAKNNLVIFTSDHGDELGEHGLHGKFVFYEGSVHVPLLMRLPGPRRHLGETSGASGAARRKRGEAATRACESKARGSARLALVATWVRISKVICGTPHEPRREKVASPTGWTDISLKNSF